MRSSSTQCNFFLGYTGRWVNKAVQCRVNKKCRGIQCSRIVPRVTGTRTIGVQATEIKTTIRTSTTVTQYDSSQGSKNAWTQCNFFLNIPTTSSVARKSNHSTPTSEEKTCPTSAVDVALRILKETPELKGLSYAISTNAAKQRSIRVTQPTYFGLLGEDLDPVQVIISDAGLCKLFVLFKELQLIDITGNGIVDKSEIAEILLALTDKSHVLCSGIHESLVRGITCKSLIVLTTPFVRYQSANCLVFYENTIAEYNRSLKKCVPCRNLCKYLSTVRRRKLVTVATQKQQKLNSSCSVERRKSRNVPVMKTRFKKRYENARKKRFKLKTDVKETELTLREIDTGKVEEIVNDANSECPGELQDSCSGAAREFRKEDEVNSEHFQQVQVKIETENEENDGCNTDTYKLNLEVYDRNSPVFQTFQDVKVLQMPHIKSLRPGEDSDNCILPHFS